MLTTVSVGVDKISKFNQIFKKKSLRTSVTFYPKGHPRRTQRGGNGRYTAYPTVPLSSLSMGLNQIELYLYTKRPVYLPVYADCWKLQFFFEKVKVYIARLVTTLWFFASWLQTQSYRSCGVGGVRAVVELVNHHGQ